MFFICFFITVLTGRVALAYFIDTPILENAAAWLVPTVDVVFYIMAALTVVIVVIKVVKIVRFNGGGVVECALVFALSLASVILAAILARSNAVLTSYMVYYALAAVVAGVVFVLALIFDLTSTRRR